MTLRMQNYMEKHKIGPLFEDLMNKVLRDMPEDPLVYVLRAVYKKAGLEIPQDIRHGGLRRSPSGMARGRSKSPDKMPVSSSADAALGTRDYDKPWKSQAKRLKPKKSSDDAELSRSQSSRLHSAPLSDSTVGELLRVTPVKLARRQRPDWNSDVKMKTTSFDELWEDTSPLKRDDPVRSETVGIMKKSWARVGLDDEDDNIYSSNKYTGPRHAHFKSDEDLLAAENIVSSRKDNVYQEKTVGKSKSSRSHKLNAAQHRQELEKLLLESEKRPTDLGYTEEPGEDDEALEMLEDADDLRREGVTNIPASGYRLSKIMRQRQSEPTVKLNINLFPRPEPAPSVQGDPYEEYGVYDSDMEYRPRAGSPSGVESDDEFESVSQVTGPRRPVWNVPDSDGESYIPRPAFSTPQPSKAKGRPSKHRHLSSTGPARYNIQSPGRSLESVDDSTQEGVKTWTPGAGSSHQRLMSPDGGNEVRESLQSARGGWTFPDDSDASFTEFSNRKGSSHREPRAY
ncbi:uncharacterized protein C8orf34 homolog isoform X1 [Haliotis asinina]|uniref:uncharacterized protein C8orf34 homolog isoform X1 n=1 Tax=Haliotis asinina TaxID=109174 RepID=UPI0035327041